MTILIQMMVWCLALSSTGCKVVYIYAFIQSGAIFPQNTTESMGTSDSFFGKLSTVGMRQQYNLDILLKENYITDEELGFEWYD